MVLVVQVVQVVMVEVVVVEVSYPGFAWGEDMTQPAAGL